MRSTAKHARSQYILLSGRLTELNECTAFSLQNYPPIQVILQRCVEFLPVLKHARFDSQEQVRVALCPLCNEHV